MASIKASRGPEHTGSVTESHEEERRPSPEPPTLPNVPDDERDVGWGDDPNSGRRDEDWYRRERPPHHG